MDSRQWGIESGYESGLLPGHSYSSLSEAGEAIDSLYRKFDEMDMDMADGRGSVYRGCALWAVLESDATHPEVWHRRDGGGWGPRLVEQDGVGRW